MSNVYPEWWCDTVTLYNKTEDKSTHVVTWYRSVIPGVFWKFTGNKVVINNVTIQTEDIIARLRKDDEHFKTIAEWQALPNDEKSDYYTLQNDDILIKGEVDDIIDEYTSGHRSTDLLDKYRQLGECMQVQRVAINVGPGRGQEHYYVRGI